MRIVVITGPTTQEKRILDTSGADFSKQEDEEFMCRRASAESICTASASLGSMTF
jgi:hypothetical protein